MPFLKTLKFYFNQFCGGVYVVYLKFLAASDGDILPFFIWKDRSIPLVTRVEGILDLWDLFPVRRDHTDVLAGESGVLECEQFLKKEWFVNENNQFIIAGGRKGGLAPTQLSYPQSGCPGNQLQFQCANNNSCLSSSVVCDGQWQCSDGSDEYFLSNLWQNRRPL